MRNILSLNSIMRKIGTVVVMIVVVAGAALSVGASESIEKKEVEKKSLIPPTAQRAIKRGLDYLAAHQHDDGSFGSNHLRGNTAVTSLAGIAMLAQGSTPGRGKYGKPIDRIVDYLLKHTEKDGLIINREATTRGAMYEQGFAVLFLAECHGMSKHPELRKKLALAVKLILDTQNEQGGWRYDPIREKADISVTTCQVMALRAAKNAGIHVPSTTIDAAVRYIRDCRNPDGGFKYIIDVEAPSMFPRSAAAVAALQSAGIYEGKDLEQSLDYLMEYLPRGGKKKDTTYFYYGQYYAASAFWIAGETRFGRWYGAVRDELLSRQREDGSWPSPYSASYATAMSCIVLQMPKHYLPIFER